MNKNQDTKEKICAFYASDYHFEMMSLPYMDSKMEKDRIIILPENNLEETMERFLSKTNLKEEKKKQILDLNWKNNNLEKLEEIKSKTKQDIIIFVKGKENYIKEINQKIDTYLPKENQVKIIDCYELEEIGENLDDVMDQYKKVLETTGEKEIEKL